jgi:hypothetical protein
MCLKEAHGLFSPHMEASISHNGSKGVMNFIMGSYVFITMSTM